MSNRPRAALICAVSGQDGSYLAQLLLERGDTVHENTSFRQRSPNAVAKSAAHREGANYAEAYAWYHVDIDETLYRPAGITHASATPSRAGERLGWKANARMPGIIPMMTAAELAETAG